MKSCSRILHFLQIVQHMSIYFIGVRKGLFDFKISKKVLLHERKSHTACRVGSTLCCSVFWGVGWYPHPVQVGGGYPIQS